MWEQVEQLPPPQEAQPLLVRDMDSPLEPLDTAANTEMARLEGSPQSGQGTSPSKLIDWSFWKRVWQVSQTYS